MYTEYDTHRNQVLELKKNKKNESYNATWDTAPTVAATNAWADTAPAVAATNTWADTVTTAATNEDDQTGMKILTCVPCIHT